MRRTNLYTDDIRITEYVLSLLSVERKTFGSPQIIQHINHDWSTPAVVLFSLVSLKSTTTLLTRQRSLRGLVAHEAIPPHPTLRERTPAPREFCGDPRAVMQGGRLLYFFFLRLYLVFDLRLLFFKIRSIETKKKGSVLLCSVEVLVGLC